MKLAPEREFKTVFLGITKKTQSGRLQLADFTFFVNIARRISDYLHWNHVLVSLTVFFQLIDGHQLM